MKLRSIALIILLPACTANDAGTALPSAKDFPASPHECAGPESSHDEAGRLAKWTEVGMALGSASDVMEVRFGVSKRMTPEEAVALPAPMALTGVTAYFATTNGQAITFNFGSDEPISDADQLRKTALEALPPSLPGISSDEESRARVIAGDIPIGAVLVRGAPVEMVHLVKDNPCVIYSAGLSGPGNTAPPVHPSVVPPRQPPHPMPSGCFLGPLMPPECVRPSP